MPRTPEVIEGYRGPRTDERPKAPASPAKVIPEGKTVFQFVADRYRLQLTAPKALSLPDGRVQEPDRALVLMAEEGFVTLDTKKDAKTIQMVREHPHYGQDFWDYADTLKRLQEAKTKEAIKVLDDPDSREKIIEALKSMGAEGFVLPAVKPRATKPAPEATQG